MSDDNQSDRIYMRSSKPGNEMAADGIRAFAGVMHERIMDQTSADKQAEES